MGYEAQKLLVVTCHSEATLEVARAKAVECFGARSDLVAPIMGPFINRRATFFVAPDGSKEGWADSDEVDLIMEQYLEWLTSYRKDEPWSYNPFKWALYQFTADESDDVWAVGYRHVFGAPPKEFAKFADRSNGDDAGVGPTRIWRDSSPEPEAKQHPAT